MKLARTPQVKGRHVVVVGAGLSGLSATLHLLGAGHRVTVLERETVPGGRNGILRRQGFRFDTGPVVFTMMPLLEEAFAAVGRTVEDYARLHLLNPAYHTFFADGSRLLVRPGHEKMRAEILSKCGITDALAFDDFVAWLARPNDVELPHFIDANFDSPLDLFRSPRAAVELLRLGAFRRLGPEVARRFSDERLHRVFSFQAMYAGLAPAQALALYAVITYMDSIEGVWFPEGGMHAVPAAMARAAEDAGAEIRYDCDVDRVDRTPQGRARGVVLADGTRVAADAVVVTADLPVAYERLLPGVRAPRVARRGRYSPSALVWHLGVKGDLPPHLGQQAERLAVNPRPQDELQRQRDHQAPRHQGQVLPPVVHHPPDAAGAPTLILPSPGRRRQGAGRSRRRQRGIGGGRPTPRRRARRPERSARALTRRPDPRSQVPPPYA